MLTEILDLIEKVLMRTKTVKQAVILGTTLLMVLSCVIASGLAALIFLERKELLEILNRQRTRTLPHRVTERDKHKLKAFYTVTRPSTKSVQLVHYDKKHRVTTVLYSYPEVTHISRPFSMDSSTIQEHFMLECSTEVRKGATFYTSCPVYHGTDYGVEGFILAIWELDKQSVGMLDMTVFTVEHSLADIAATIGATNR